MKDVCPERDRETTLSAIGIAVPALQRSDTQSR
jgi:hypothetical protein